MKRILVFSLLATLSSNVFSQTAEELEKDCSRAVVGFLKEKGVITGGEDGLCISDLKSLPEIHIGMGSRTFPLGNADQFNVSKKTQDNLQTLRSVLTTGNDKASVSFTGYADGEQNNIQQFDSRFLASGETTFTKQDLKNKISDTRSLKTLLDLLEKYGDTDKIPYDQSKPELKTAQSLIRNYYLANDRAKKVCETAMPSGTDCSKKEISGFASPSLEVAGNKQCDARRRAFLSFNLSPSGMNKASANNGKYGPHFETPNPLEYQRDLQIAASADLFAKLAKQTQGTNLDEYSKNIDLILPRECMSNPALLENTRDNSKRLIAQVKEALDSVTSADFKSMIVKGDYISIKKKLNQLNDKEDSGKALTTEELAQQKVIEIITAGKDRVQAGDSLDITSNSNYKKKGKESIIERTLPNGKIEKLRIVYVSEGRSDYVSSAIAYQENGQQVLIKSNEINSLQYEWKKNLDKSLYAIKSPGDHYVGRGVNVVDSRFPKASLANTPSTDSFNCFSVAAAIEENMQSNNDTLVDASLLVSGEQAKLKVYLDSRSVAHLNNDDKKPQGWACAACGSGVTFNEKGKLAYQPRDFENAYSSAQAVALQQNSSSLTMGSLKNLKVFNISREAFGDNCPNSKAVCDCVKNITPGKGELEKVLSHGSTEKVAMTGQSDVYPNNPATRFENTWTLPDPKNNCIFTPPVPHTCQVDPKGRSKESRGSNKSNIMACKILDGLKQKFNLATDIDVNKYKTVVLGGSVCKKSLPTSDEEGDCGYKRPSGGSGTVSGAAKQ